MKFLRRLLSTIVGLFFNLAGLAGGSDQVANWAHWLGVVHQALGNPVVWLGSTLIGTALLAYTWGDYLAERTLEKAGGITKREFPANFGQWDRVKNFAVWQVAWLWNGLEPHNIENSGTRAYPTFRKLKEDLNAGLVKGAHRDSSGSWKDVSLDRQSLIDYAANIGESPAFLFPHKRSWLERQKARLWGYREATPQEIKQYEDIYRWFGIAGMTKPPTPIEEVRKWLVIELKAGRFIAIARPRHHDINWPYVHIPQSCWNHLQLDRRDVVLDGTDEYVSLRLKKLADYSSSP